MKARQSLFTAMILTFALLLAANSNAELAGPHNAANNIGCFNYCHIMPETKSPYWDHTPSDIDDTPYNYLCNSCHTATSGPYSMINAPKVLTHSSLNTDDGYGNWTTECIDCHSPHYQEQLEWINQGGTGIFVATGNITGYSYNGGTGETTLDYDSTIFYKAGWDAAKLVRKTIDYRRAILIPDVNTLTPDTTDDLSYQVVAVDEVLKKITVKGDASTVLDDVTLPSSFGIIYGQLVREYVKTNGLLKKVKFFDKIAGGNGGLTDQSSSVNPSGICQACHTQTAHWSPSALAGGDVHFPSQSCVDCHKHTDGFAHGGGGGCGTAIECHGTHEAHKTHTGAMVGIACADCHDTDNFPLFSDGQALTNTIACDNCHSADGVTNAKGYFISGGWAATEGEASFCGSCHDLTPGNTQADGSGDAAQNVLGDNSTYGYYVTGHGKAAGNYANLSWQDGAAVGNPAAAQACSGCHDYTSQHFNTGSAKRLKAGYENDQSNSNCNQCHAPAGIADAAPKYYTDSPDYEGSAHGGKFCTECHEVHGSGGVYVGMTKGDKQSLCYQCHTEGGVMNNALSGNVNDIQEAFGQGETHNLGTSFVNDGKTYSLQCTSCHNVHLITGKYWDAEQVNKTPVTRFPPDGESSGKSHLEAWGDESGEKTDDFAARGSGTGGFAYKTAQGYSLGATGLPFDQPAKYQPPKKSSGYDWEFSGEVLPDYTTFCLDCHSSRMADDVGAINWGQGIGGGFPEPPGSGYANWVNTSAPHGLSSANTSSYISDSGTAGFWGASGNPDVLFDMNYVTRGRHTGHFMRWPYETADRSAGINYVMACTDCHEAHGSSVNSMLRTTVNTGPGTGIWNTMCNNCHYYYAGQHAGMSCATASCHEGYSIHRIKKNGGGGSTQLMLTSAGYEDDFQRPDFTPEIELVACHIGSNELQVTFRSSQYGAGTPGLFGESDLSGALTKDDFWLFDKGNNNPRTITSVTHTAGEMIATLTMSAPLAEADLSTDTLAMKPASAWGWYEGGYNNFDSGAIPEQAVSAGPWPVTLTGPPPFNIQSVLYGGLQLKLNGIIDDSNQLYVTFAEGAYSNSDTSGDLQAGDFVPDCGGRTISSVTHSADDSFAILTLNTNVNQSEVGVCTVAAASVSIFDPSGNPAGTSAVTLALPPEASVNDLVLRWDFNEASGVAESNTTLGTQEDMHGVLTRNVARVTSTKPGAGGAGDNAVSMDRVSDRGAVQLNYEVDPGDGFPAKFTNVQETQYTGEFSFSVWIKPTSLGCVEGQDLGLNVKLRRDVLTTQFWIKNWALGIMRFSDDGDPLDGNCTTEDSTHDVLRFWVAVGNPADMRCDAWGGSWPEYVHPVSPAGYTQGTTLMPTDQAVCDTSANPTLPTNTQAHSFAQTETSASGAPTYGGVALQPGVWQHVVGTWDGRYIRIYIDSQLAAQTDMGGAGNYVMVADPLLWASGISRHVSSGFGVGARPLWSNGNSGATGVDYWNTNGFYDVNSATYVGELDDVKYWKTALPLSTIQN